MKIALEAFIFFLITFSVISFFYYYVFLKRRFNEYSGKVKGKKKSKKSRNEALDFMEFTYLMSKFNLDLKKMDVLYVLKWIAILDALIIAVTGTIIYYIPWHMIWKFLIGFVMLFALIYSVYELFGRHLVKKGWSKNEH